MKIPIRALIQSGAWFHCEAPYYDEITKCRIRFNSFEKLDVRSMAGAQINHPALQEGELWVLRFDITTLEKKSVSSYKIVDAWLIVDQDDCEFKHSHELLVKGCPTPIGMDVDRMCFEELRPKMVVHAAITYLLPFQEEAEYFLQMRQGGSLVEV